MAADPFLDAEASVDVSQPREFYEIVQDSTVTYRIASGTRDIIYNGDTYTALTAARTEIAVSTVTEQAQLTFSLPLSHPLCQRYFAQASPPRQISVVVYRRQVDVGDERIFGGLVTSCAVERTFAKFSLESRFARALRRQLPMLRAGKLCPYILYDQNCRANRNGFTLGIPTSIVPVLTVTGFDGRLVTISSDGGVPSQWAQNGEFVHIATGERMPIFSQVGTILTLQAPIPGIQVGNAITVSAGCAHDIVTCRTKFANQVNFGGFPQLPTRNVFLPTGLGVVEQT